MKSIFIMKNLKVQKIIISMIIYICMVIFPGCVTSVMHPALRTASLPELLDRDIFFNPKGSSYEYKISPDGKKLAWIAASGEGFTLFFKRFGDHTGTRIDTHCWCNVSWFSWGTDSQHIFFTLQTGRKRPRHIYMSEIDKPSDRPVDITPNAEYYATIENFGPIAPHNVIVSQNSRCRSCFDLYKIDALNPRPNLLENGETATIQWIIDRQNQLKGRIIARHDRSLDLELYDGEKKSWIQLEKWEKRENIRFLGFTPDNTGMWLLSNKNRDKESLVRFDVKTRKESVICEDSIADIETALISPKTGKPLFAYAVPGLPKTYILDADLKNDLQHFVDSIKPDGLTINSMDDSENLITLKVWNEKDSRFYLFDRTTRQATLLGKKGWPANPSALNKLEPVTIVSRDGLPLIGYLSKPVLENPQKLPMVLYVHGGPWARDYWEPDPMVQFLSNRGYAVLQINYRGSSGFGRAYQDAANGEFAGKMHDDLIDAVNWAVKKNIADPDNIAIAGYSYGGYAAMAGLAFTPDVFKCGIAINGVSNWMDYLNGFPDPPPLYRKRGTGIWLDFLGDPDKSKDRPDIEKRSPLFFAENVKNPILIVYGNQDGIVDASQSVKMIAELKKYGKKVYQKEFDSQGHSIHYLKSSKVLYMEIEHFLARFLGGRAQRRSQY